MGTSAAADPVRGEHPLLPAWLQDQDEDQRDASNHTVPAAASDESPSGADDSQGAGGGSQNRPVLNAGQQFADPRSNITGAIRLISTGAGAGTPHGGRRGGRGARRTAQTPESRIRKGVSQYIATRGGPAGAARRLGVAVDIGARLFDALDRIARDGFDAALTALGLSVSDRSAAAIADSLITLVCEDATRGIDGILDESMARAACDETFIALYQEGISLASLSPDQVPMVIQNFAVNAACLLITREIGTAIIDRPRTEEQARTLQSTLKSVIESSLRIELPNRGAGSFTIRDFRDAIKNAYENAFRILRAAGS